MNTRPTLLSEKQLVILLKSNNKACFEYLYDQYAPALYNIACKILRDEPLAGDVIQDSFVKIWKKIEHYNPEKGSLFTWMLNITRRTAIDAHRANSKHKSSICWDDLSEDELSGGAVIAPVTATVDVRSMLDTLAAEKKILIELVYFEGYTHEQASLHLGLPLGTVKSRTRKALSELRQLFEHSSAGLQPA